MVSSVGALKEAVKSNDEKKIEEYRISLLLAAKDPISQWLDKEQGSNVKDNDIFMTLPRYWETKFQEDMKALNVCIFR